MLISDWSSDVCSSDLLRQNRYNMESALSELRAQRKTAKDLYDRNKLLFDDGIISEQEFLKYQIDYNRLDEHYRIEVETQKYKTQNEQLQHKQLEGPIDRTHRNMTILKEKLNNQNIR